jgi:hypothetical protein
MVAEELDELGRASCDEGLFVFDGFGDVAVAVRRVVFPFVGRSAGAAVVVQPPAGFAAPGEAGHR